MSSKGSRLQPCVVTSHHRISRHDRVLVVYHRILQSEVNAVTPPAVAVVVVAGVLHPSPQVLVRIGLLPRMYRYMQKNPAVENKKR